MSTPPELTEAIAEAAVALGRLHALLAQEPATLGMRWSERNVAQMYLGQALRALADLRGWIRRTR